MIHVLASDLPKYMKEVLGFSVDEIGLYSSLPYLLMFLMSLFFGFVSDHLISGHYVTITQARKFISSLGWFSMTNLQFTVEYFNSNYRFDFILFYFSMQIAYFHPFVSLLPLMLAATSFGLTFGSRWPLDS